MLFHRIWQKVPTLENMVLTHFKSGGFIFPVQHVKLQHEKVVFNIVISAT